MFNFFKKKQEDYPEYWQVYEQSFREKEKQDIADTRFVVFDTETTGFNYKTDRILSIGAVPVIHNTISVPDIMEIYIKQDMFNPETVKIHGLLREDGRVEAIDEEKAIQQFLAYISNAVLVAHHVHFDTSMINAALKRMGLPKLKNKVLDTSVLYNRTRITSNLIDRNKNHSLDELADALNISKSDRHTATGDAYITAVAFLKILSRLEKKGIYKSSKLF
ncbi:3'-5' exonuclease [Sinomicrobium weinanense]|uniref:3'-5' exonuclease n=1 Tax=Sinomicrobium weinanense TaxID=2842200 RepID=A0A926JUR0_9FLAO|nr:3'-5' exonuclease [Sinomicrobium weinanense]MBC9797925.1 3'-5' exonuclease [Sinomicrobium weinanense]MBU3123186.1 3'-5' exonuclease [Sinomicrobium weinanense]